jgi:hypothetical protein
VKALAALIVLKSFIRVKKTTTNTDKHMAAPVTLTATTLEGQLLQIVEALTNAQLVATAAAAPGVTVRRIVTQNTSDDISGLKSVAISLPIAIEASANGLATVAIAVY